MTIARCRTVRSGNSEAVRLPKAYLLDSNVAIHLRDGDPTISAKVAALDDAILLSIVTRVELDGGVYRDTAHAPARRARLDTLLRAIPVLAFDEPAADAYAAIVVHAGYARRKLLDRMIAAHALVHRATLVTMNAEAFREIAGLEVLAWHGSALSDDTARRLGNGVFGMGACPCLRNGSKTLPLDRAFLHC